MTAKRRMLGSPFIRNGSIQWLPGDAKNISSLLSEKKPVRSAEITNKEIRGYCILFGGFCLLYSLFGAGSLLFKGITFIVLSVLLALSIRFNPYIHGRIKNEGVRLIVLLIYMTIGVASILHNIMQMRRLNTTSGHSQPVSPAINTARFTTAVPPTNPPPAQATAVPRRSRGPTGATGIGVFLPSTTGTVRP